MQSLPPVCIATLRYLLAQVLYSTNAKRCLKLWSVCVIDQKDQIESLCIELLINLFMAMRWNPNRATQFTTVASHHRVRVDGAITWWCYDNSTMVWWRWRNGSSVRWWWCGAPWRHRYHIIAPSWSQHCTVDVLANGLFLRKWLKM